MKIASWNINGIRARKDALRAWIIRNQPDMLVLQEVKAAEEDIPHEVVGLEQYRKFWNGSSVRKGYSGIGILMRDSASADNSVWEIPPFDLENRTGVLHTPLFSLIGTLSAAWRECGALPQKA